MARLLGIRIKNYRALADFRLGQVKYARGGEPLPRLACLIGPNGSGKSTVLDAFGFVAECLLEGVVAERLVVELKACQGLLPIHRAQVLSYLKASDRSLGLLINFNVRLLRQGIRRVVRTR